MNKLYFQINEGKPVEFATVKEGESFFLEITKFPTSEELEKLKERGLTKNAFFMFTDTEGHTFTIFSEHIESPDPGEVDFNNF